MKQPRDANHSPVPLVTPTTALAVTNSASISSATSITLNAATTLIEINALSQGVFMKYAAGVTSSAFDEYIQAGTVRHYVKPYGVTVISVIEQSATARVIVIEK